MFSLSFAESQGMIVANLASIILVAVLLYVTLVIPASYVQLHWWYISEWFLCVRVEVVMFNCPEWGMEVQGEAITPTITSCDSLEQVCLSVRTDMSLLTLEFTLSLNSHWVHLAEVIFSDSNNTLHHLLHPLHQTPSSLHLLQVWSLGGTCGQLPALARWWLW